VPVAEERIPLMDQLVDVLCGWGPDTAFGMVRRLCSPVRGQGLAVEQPQDVRAALEEAMAVDDGPALVDVVTSACDVQEPPC
jgi:thiamine pyrophosphate-dependent acetolactate synthase large subunit-like protein